MALELERRAEPELQKIKQGLINISSACDAVMNSESLEGALSLILHVGQVLNKSNASGFDVTHSLQNLDNTRVRGGKSAHLLHYTVLRHGLLRALKPMEAAAELTTSLSSCVFLTSEIHDLKQRYYSISQELMALEATTGDDTSVRGLNDSIVAEVSIS